MSSELPTVIVFTKNPYTVPVKSRLAQSLGEQKAREIYIELLANTLDAVRPFNAEAWVFGDNTDHRWLRGLPWFPQTAEDLGTNMARVFERRQGVLVGCDCPSMSSAYIADALDKWRTNDLVLGPVEDGGYCLIGLHEPHDELFHNIEWGTDKVLEQTICKARGAGLTTALLSELWDVDDKQDVRRWLETRHSKGTQQS